MEPTIRALLVGVNHYDQVRSLGECVKDVHKMEALLTHYYPHVHIHTITDENETPTELPTKQNIIKAFIKQLIEPAAEGDISLFYFSGHGAQEVANEVFWPGNPGRQLESLACRDTDIATSRNLIADKELRFLIHQISAKGAEAVIICDCCHAGENTRSAPADAEVLERLARNLPERPWADFIFSKDHDKAEFETKGMETLLPEGQHIQLGACESFESAVEVRGYGGVFTQALIATIKKFKGRVSYYELHSHIRRFVKAKYRQVPQVYVVGTTAGQAQQLLQRDFLSHRVSEAPLNVGVYFSADKKQWVLEAGGILGVSLKWRGLAQRIQVFDAQGQVGMASIKKVLGGESYLSFEPYADVITSETYYALVPSLLTRGLYLYLRGENAHFVNVKKELEQVPHFQLSPDEASADYCIWAQSDQFILTKPHETRPLAAKVHGSGEKSAQKLLAQVHALNKWNFLQPLHSPNTRITDSSLQVTVTWNGEEQPLQPGNKLSFAFKQVNETISDISLYLKHQHTAPLYVAVMELTMLYGITCWGKQNTLVHYLEPTQTLDLHGFGFQLEEFVVQGNLPAEKFYWQIILSETRFDVEPLLQEALAQYRGPDEDRDLVPRGLTKSPDASTDWCTFRIEVDFLNPAFKSQ